MIRAEVITPWIGVGNNDNPNRPKLMNDYSLKKWEDVTEQPSANFPLTQNAYVILVECEESVLAEIKADDTYYVLWSEVINNV